MRLQAEEVYDTKVRQGYKKDDKLKEAERDILKQWKVGGETVALIGIENQTTIDESMPRRVIQYDGNDYGSERKKQGYQVVTLILYFDYNKQWRKAKGLKSSIKIDEDMEPYVQEYGCNIFEIAFLPRETIDLFQSDFWVIADYLEQMKRTGTYIGNKRELAHPQEVFQLSVGVPRFKRAER